MNINQIIIISNIAASSHYRGQAQEAATDAIIGGSGRPTAARSMK